MKAKPRFRFDGVEWVDAPTQAIDDIEPSIDLLRQVKAAFILRGTTMKAWCRENGTHLSNVRNCLTGSWNGPRGKAMRQRVLKASGWKQSA